MQQVKLSSWGKGLALRIPRCLADSYNFQAGDVLELTPVDDGLLIKKTSSKPYRLADILDSFASSEAVPVVDIGEPRGKEIW